MGCANPDGNEWGLWCATEVDADGVYTKYYWCNMEIDACNPDGKCTTLTYTDKKDYSSNMPCVDGKWKNKGEEVEGCISTKDDAPWCATEVDSDGNWKKYGFCNMNIAACNPDDECLTQGNEPCYKGSWNHMGYGEAQGKDEEYGVGCYASEPSKKKWCATKVDRLGQYIDDNWDWCKMDMNACTFGKCYTNGGKVPNAPCVEGIWKYEGKEYEGCANPDYNKASGIWCPTELDGDGNYIDGKWGACNMALDACNPEGEYYIFTFIAYLS